jgi:hypothetical protein
MEIRAYRGDTTVDAFVAPGTAPFYEPPPAPTGIIRYEEDHPALRYNGDPYVQTEYCFLTAGACPGGGRAAAATSPNRTVPETR